MKPMQEVIREVARSYGVLVSEIRGPLKFKEILDARKEFIRRAGEDGRGQSEVARFLGCDPSTINHHYKKMGIKV